METKKICHILAICGIIVLIIAFSFKFECVFKSFIHIPCPACGLTRGFISIFNLDLISAIKYNILSIPLFIIIIIFYLLYFMLVFFEKKYILKLYDVFSKNYKIVLFILLVSWFINIVKFMS